MDIIILCRFYILSYDVSTQNVTDGKTNSMSRFKLYLGSVRYSVSVSAALTMKGEGN
jgi:hypothetical protein